MATRVNTRFVLLAIVATGLILALLGGVYLLRLRGDATRNFRRGEEAFAKADYRVAADQFGRALHKEPGNPEYLRRVEESIIRIIPDNPTDAGERYSAYMGILGHASLHNPSSVDAHLRLIREVHAGARRMNVTRAWETLISAADNMQQQADDGDRRKHYAAVYRSIGIARLTSTQQEEAIRQAIQDLDIAAAALENDDLAWSSAITSRLAWVNRMIASGSPRADIESQQAELVEVAERALERVPGGPETLRAYLLYLLTRQSQGSSVEPAQVVAIADRLAQSVPSDADSGLVWEAAQLIDLVPDIGRPRSISLLQRVLSSRPEALDLRTLLARLQFRQEQLDDAEASARQVIGAERLPVSFLSQIQFDLERQSAALIGDIEFRRWQVAAEADKAARLAKVDEARAVLASLVGQGVSDPALTRLEAKIAFAKQEYSKAAELFETLVRSAGGVDAESLSFAAAALERVGQLGLAHERTAQLLAQSPNYFPAIIEKARLEVALGRPEQAADTIESIPDDAALDAYAQQVVATVRRMASAESGTADPVQTALADADDAMRRGEPDNARAGLLAALDTNMDSVPLLQALAQVELRAGRREEASAFVQRGIALQPDNSLLKALDFSLRFEDPVEATREFVTASVTEGTARSQSMLIAMNSLAVQQERIAAQSSDPTAADKARDVAERARTHARDAATDLARLNPESPAIVEYQFSQALIAKDWSAAEQALSIARRLDLDRAGGNLYKGRLELARGNSREAISALETATSRLSFSSTAWRLLALAQQQAGNFVEAERAYDQAYRCNPTDIEVARPLMQLLLNRGDKSRALQIIQSVHRLAPQDATLREAWLNLEADVGSKTVALSERVKAYRKAPNDRENATGLAMLLVGLDPTRETILTADGEPEYSAPRWSAMSPTEQEDVRRRAVQRWQAMADEIIANVAKDASDDLQLAILRAIALRERGDIAAGESVLQEFIARQDASARTEDMYVELGRYQASVSHYNDAIESMRQAVALGGPKQREAEVGLATLLVQLGQFDEALKTLESVLAKQDDQATRLQVIECLINLKRFDDAESRLKEVAATGGGSVITLLEARLAESRALQSLEAGDLEGASRLVASQRELLAKAESLDPTNPFPRILLARSLLDEYARTQRVSLLDDALVALERADRIRSGRPETSALRVLVLKAKGDLNGAMAELRRSLQIAPDNLVARRDLIQMLMDAGNVTGAMAAVDAAIRDNPTIATWHELKGDLLVRNDGDARQAVQEYTTAYEQSPSTALLAKVVDALLLCDPPDCRAAADRLAERREDFKTEPALCEADAVVLNCLGQRDQALSQLRVAYNLRAEQIRSGAKPATSIAQWFVAMATIFRPEQAAEAETLLNELNGGQPSPFEMAGLARLWVRAGPSGVTRSQELQRRAIELTADADVKVREGLLYDLAGMLLVTGDPASAAKAYEDVLRLSPTNVSALNNLAFLKADVLGQVDEAVPLAERLLELAPEQAPILDTVGWVYFKSKDVARAKQHLSRSLAILPSSDAYIHLATILTSEGDAAGAEKHLAAAEKLGLTAEEQQKVSALRDDIRKGAAAGR